jgi:hypothetical protein
LTLTSNEDSINVYPDDCLSAKCNLPDVLPVGVKYQNQTRYPAINNNYTSPSPKIQVAQTAPACIAGNAQSKSIFHFPIGGATYTTTGGNSNNNTNTSHQHLSYSHNHQKTSPTNGPAMFHAASQAQPQCPVYNKPKSNSTDAVSPKYMSQSTFDLKKTQIIETTQVFTTNEDLFKEQHAELKELETPFEYCEMNVTGHQNGLQLLGNGCDEGRDGEIVASHDEVDEDDDDDDDDNVQLQVQQQPATVNKSEIAKKLNFEKLESTTFMNNKNIVNSNNQLNSNSKEVNQNNSPPNSDSCGSRSSSSSSSSVTSNNASPINSGPMSPVVMTCTTGSQTPPTTDRMTPMAVINAIEIETPATNDATPDTTSLSPCDTDSLKLMQRTELVLRLNAPTAETACQTDDSIEAVVQGLDALSVAATTPPPIVFSARQKTAEELDCEKLSQDLVGQLSATDKLYNVLGEYIRNINLIKFSCLSLQCK